MLPFPLQDSGWASVVTQTDAALTQLQIEARLIEQLVLRTFEVPSPTLRTPCRGRAPVAFARQVAIYLAHVHLGLTLTAAGRLFDRDRTTAAHACRTVEDRREAPEVERRIAAIETALDSWLMMDRDREIRR